MYDTSILKGKRTIVDAEFRRCILVASVKLYPTNDVSYSNSYMATCTTYPIVERVTKNYWTKNPTLAGTYVVPFKIQTVHVAGNNDEECLLNSIKLSFNRLNKTDILESTGKIGRNGEFGRSCILIDCDTDNPLVSWYMTDSEVCITEPIARKVFTIKDLFIRNKSKLTLVDKHLRVRSMYRIDEFRKRYGGV